jgi:hypothetical protein
LSNNDKSGLTAKKTRNMLAGKRYASHEEMLEALFNDYILKGIIERKELATLTGKDESSIFRLLRELAEQGKVKIDPITKRVVYEKEIQAKAEIRALEFDTTDEFEAAYPLVKTWMDKKRNTVKNWSYLRSNLKALCDTLKLAPDNILAIARFRVQGEKSLDELMTRFQSEFRKKNNPKIKYGGLKSYSVAVIDFVRFHGVSIPEKLEGALSRAKSNFGAYNDIELSDPQIEQGTSYAAKRFGSHEAIFFGLGIESMHRFNAGINLTTSDLNLKKFGDYEYFTFKVFESKTEKTFTKLIIHPKLVRLVKAFIAKRGAGYPLFHKEIPTSKLLGYYCETNRAIFSSLGIDVARDGQGNLINYWKDKSEHTLRHCGIKLWLRRLGFNATLVALMTHDDVSTTAKVYGGLSVESLFQQGHCWYHDPPEIKSENAVFCSLKCAIQYLNKEDDLSNYEARDLEKELGELKVIEARATK